jgi:hypothetical protein
MIFKGKEKRYIFTNKLTIQNFFKNCNKLYGTIAGIGKKIYKK